MADLRREKICAETKNTHFGGCADRERGVTIVYVDRGARRVRSGPSRLDGREAPDKGGGNTQDVREDAETGYYPWVLPPAARNSARLTKMGLGGIALYDVSV